MCLFVEQMCLHNVADRVLASQARVGILHLVWTLLKLEFLKLLYQVKRSLLNGVFVFYILIPVKLSRRISIRVFKISSDLLQMGTTNIILKLMCVVLFDHSKSANIELHQVWFKWLAAT